MSSDRRGEDLCRAVEEEVFGMDEGVGSLLTLSIFFERAVTLIKAKDYEISINIPLGNDLSRSVTTFSLIGLASNRCEYQGCSLSSDPGKAVVEAGLEALLTAHRHGWTISGENDHAARFMRELKALRAFHKLYKPSGRTRVGTPGGLMATDYPSVTLAVWNAAEAARGER